MSGSWRSGQEPVYADRLVELTASTIRFRCYYFPSGSSKSVALSLVERIEVRPARPGTGRWRVWGTSDFITWFPLDWSRPWRKSIFMLHPKDKVCRIGFTVENEDLFRQALEGLGITVWPA